MNKSHSVFPPLLTTSLLLLAAAAVHILNLSRSMRYDEAYTVLHYTHNPGQALLFYNLPNNHLLHSFLVWIARNTLGLAPIAVRLPAFAAGLLALAMTYRVTQRLVNHRAGLMALALVTVNLSFADYLVNARGYTLTILLSLILYDLVFVQRKIRGMTILAVCMAAMMTMPSMAVPIAGNAVWLVWKYRGLNHRTLRYWMPMIVGSVAGLIFYVPSLLTNGTSGMLRFGSQGWAELASSLWQLMFSGSLGIVFLILAALGIVLSLRRSTSFLVWLGCQLLAILILALVQYALTGTLFFARNYLYLLPFIALLAGASLRDAWQPVAVLLATALLLIALPDLQRLRQPNAIDHLRDLVKSSTMESDAILIGAGYAEPVYYHVILDSYQERLRVTDQKTRLLIVESDWEDYESVARTNNIADTVINGCVPLNEPSWEPFSVYSCGLQPGQTQ